MSDTHRYPQLALPADQGVEHLHSSSQMLLDTTHAIGHCPNGRGRARRSRVLRGQVDRQGCPSFKVLTQLQEAWRQSDESGDACWLTPADGEVQPVPQMGVITFWGRAPHSSTSCDSAVWHHRPRRSTPVYRSVDCRVRSCRFEVESHGPRRYENWRCRYDLRKSGSISLPLSVLRKERFD